MWLPFGHSSLELSRGPALLACRYRLPVLYGVAPQVAHGRTAVALKPFETLATDNLAPTSPEEVAAIWLQHLHRDITRYPDQWWEWPFQTIESAERAPRFAAAAPHSIPLTLERVS